MSMNFLRTASDKLNAQSRSLESLHRQLTTPLEA